MLLNNLTRRLSYTYKNNSNYKPPYISDIQKNNGVVNLKIHYYEFNDTFANRYEECIDYQEIHKKANLNGLRIEITNPNDELHHYTGYVVDTEGYFPIDEINTHSDNYYYFL